MKNNNLKNAVIFTAFLVAFIPVVVHAEGVIQLPQTGQTSCYDASGTIITCSGTGQDGELRAGVDWPNPRFTDKGDQTVLDNLTGLIWTKDGNVMKTRDPGFDTDDYYDGDGRVTWQHALDYIKKLNQETYLGYNDWRLPNVIELESLVHAGQSISAYFLNMQGLSNVQASNYWSSSTFAGYTENGHPIYAWIVDMYDGNVNNYPKSAMSGGNCVWPVRSGQSGTLGSSIISLPRTGQTTCYNASGSSIACAGTGQDGELQIGAAWPGTRFADNGDLTVLDNLTGLIWTKDGKTPGTATCEPGGTKSWQGALDYMKCLNTNNYLGHNDWRLPNRKALWSLVHAGQNISANWLNLQGLSNVQADAYWSSSSVVGYTSDAWIVALYGGNVNDYHKSSSYYVWPVRSGQSGSFASLVISESGSGTVTSTPTGIACSSANAECSAPFATGMNVTLTATADAGSTFTGWSGGVCSGTSTTCQVTMDGDKTVTATFILKGDLDMSGSVNLTDAILALQTLSSSQTIALIHKEADVDGDNKIGIAEASYALQCIARLRNNHSPVLNPISNKMIDEGSTLSFTISAIDADNDPLIFSTSHLPNGATFNASTRTFSWTPTYSQSGTYQVSFASDDGYGGIDSETITITVNDVAPPNAPSNLSTSSGNTQATILWSPVAGATSYNIYWSTTSGVNKSTGTKISNVTSPYTHAGLTNGSIYYYVVTSINSAGESAESVQVSATITIAVVASETWNGSFGDGVGSAQFTFVKTSDGAVTAEGEWTYGSTVCPFVSAPVTISGTSLNFTASGTARTGSDTSGFTATVNGTASSGHASGTYSVTFNTPGWSQQGSPYWTGYRTSGSGITN